MKEGSRPSRCDICDYSCSENNNLKRHIESVQEGRKPFRCNICAYRCSFKSSLKRHTESVHEGNKPFQCSICDYKCTLRGIFEKHRVPTHEEIKNYCLALQTKNNFSLIINSTYTGSMLSGFLFFSVWQLGSLNSKPRIDIRIEIFPRWNFFHKDLKNLPFF